MLIYVHVPLNLAPNRAAPSRLTSSGRSKKHGQRKLLALDRIPLLLSLKHSKMRLKVDEAIQAAQDAAQSALHISDIATARCALEQTHNIRDSVHYSSSKIVNQIQMYWIHDLRTRILY